MLVRRCWHWRRQARGQQAPAPPPHSLLARQVEVVTTMITIVTTTTTIFTTTTDIFNSTSTDFFPQLSDRLENHRQETQANLTINITSQKSYQTYINWGVSKICPKIMSFSASRFIWGIVDRVLPSQDLLNRQRHQFQEVGAPNRVSGKTMKFSNGKVFKFIKTKRIHYDEVTLFRLRIPRLLVLAGGTLQNLTNIYNFTNVTSTKFFLALSWHEGSAQRVPEPDPLPGISFDTRPDPIQF